MVTAKINGQWINTKKYNPRKETSTTSSKTPNEQTIEELKNKGYTESVNEQGEKILKAPEETYASYIDKKYGKQYSKYSPKIYKLKDGIITEAQEYSPKLVEGTTYWQIIEPKNTFIEKYDWNKGEIERTDTGAKNTSSFSMQTTKDNKKSNTTNSNKSNDIVTYSYMKNGYKVTTNTNPNITYDLYNKAIKSNIRAENLKQVKDISTKQVFEAIKPKEQITIKYDTKGNIIGYNNPNNKTSQLYNINEDKIRTNQKQRTEDLKIKELIKKTINPLYASNNPTTKAVGQGINEAIYTIGVEGSKSVRRGTWSIINKMLIHDAKYDPNIKKLKEKLDKQYPQEIKDAIKNSTEEDELNAVITYGSLGANSLLKQIANTPTNSEIIRSLAEKGLKGEKLLFKGIGTKIGYDTIKENPTTTGITKGIIYATIPYEKEDLNKLTNFGKNILRQTRPDIIITSTETAQNFPKADRKLQTKELKGKTKIEVLSGSPYGEPYINEPQKNIGTEGTKGYFGTQAIELKNGQKIYIGWEGFIKKRPTTRLSIDNLPINKMWHITEAEYKTLKNKNIKNYYKQIETIANIKNNPIITEPPKTIRGLKQPELERFVVTPNNNKNKFLTEIGKKRIYQGFDKLGNPVYKYADKQPIKNRIKNELQRQKKNIKLHSKKNELYEDFVSNRAKHKWELLQQKKQEVIESGLFDNSGQKHIDNVYNTAIKLAKKNRLKPNLKLLKAFAEVHDIYKQKNHNFNTNKITGNAIKNNKLDFIPSVKKLSKKEKNQLAKLVYYDEISPINIKNIILDERRKNINPFVKLSKQEKLIINADRIARFGYKADPKMLYEINKKNLTKKQINKINKKQEKLKKQFNKLNNKISKTDKDNIRLQQISDEIIVSNKKYDIKTYKNNYKNKEYDYKKNKYVINKYKTNYTKNNNYKNNYNKSYKINKYNYNNIKSYKPYQIKTYKRIGKYNQPKKVNKYKPTNYNSNNYYAIKTTTYKNNYPKNKNKYTTTIKINKLKERDNKRKEKPQSQKYNTKYKQNIDPYYKLLGKRKYSMELNKILRERYGSAYS